MNYQILLQSVGVFALTYVGLIVAMVVWQMLTSKKASKISGGSDAWHRVNPAWQPVGPSGPGPAAPVAPAMPSFAIPARTVCPAGMPIVNGKCVPAGRLVH